MDIYRYLCPDIDICRYSCQNIDICRYLYWILGLSLRSSSCSKPPVTWISDAAMLMPWQVTESLKDFETVYINGQSMYQNNAGPLNFHADAKAKLLRFPLHRHMDMSYTGTWLSTQAHGYVFTWSTVTRHNVNIHMCHIRVRQHPRLGLDWPCLFKTFFN